MSELDRISAAAHEAFGQWRRVIDTAQPGTRLSDQAVLVTWRERRGNPVALQLIAERYGVDELARYVAAMTQLEADYGNPS